jgi:hypothetical protein
MAGAQSAPAVLNLDRIAQALCDLCVLLFNSPVHSALRNPQSAIRNPQSEIRNPNRVQVNLGSSAHSLPHLPPVLSGQ